MELVKELFDIYSTVRSLCAQYVNMDENRKTAFPARTVFLK